MKTIVTGLVARLRAQADARRRRTLERAKARIKFDETHGGSIWKSGKGGTPHQS